MISSNYLISPDQQHRVKVVAGYALQQRLGSGSFAVVYKGVRLPQQALTTATTTAAATPAAETVAIKAISRTSEKLTKKVLQNLEIEISILRTYRHPNIVCMHDVQKTEQHFYLILEYCAGGDVQGLIRTRQAGRLSEGLTRRLMRDLSAGLKFLWGQELIHRDIKPQNLLLTGPLPLDEEVDPSKPPQLEQERQIANFNSDAFALKIADFGFARHLQSASLAETLCGSPIYMAPEILQHQRYDAKADLWSVGTVLFEMIAGKPPFHGENHIDLLRNIKTKAVRLPPDVRVSKECVNLLRLLLNRNPLSRAGFKEFFEACDAFVALGCNGVPSKEAGTYQPHLCDLGTIQENECRVQDATLTMTSMATGTFQPNRQLAPVVEAPGTPPFGPTPTALTKAVHPQHRNHTLVPLVPSPPCSANIFSSNSLLPLAPVFNTNTQVERQVQMVETSSQRRNENLQNSAGESSFVMVELGTSHVGGQATSTALVTGNEGYAQKASDQTSPPPPPPPPQVSPGFFFGKTPVLSGRTDYMVVKPPKGMLSTSPGTGGALMGMLMGGRARLTQQKTDGRKLETRIFDAGKMLATAEDVGRRAVAVAHLGDNRAYLAMKLILLSESSLLSVTPMDGIEEDHESGAVTDDSGSTEVMKVARRRRGSSCSMPDAKVVEEMEEMPFAVQAESPPIIDTAIPTRSSSHHKSFNSSRPTMKRNPTSIRACFSDALACYVKALGMLKGAVDAVGKVKKEIEELQSHRLTPDQANQLEQVKARCNVIVGWLNEQFVGVLDRGEATNAELGKLPAAPDHQQSPAMVSVEELIYNHALASGREGAVKQLLGQQEAARACYRSAGLLAETLLMEPRVEGEDRKILEGYVDGFAARINELDETMLQQSRLSSAGSTTTTSRRGPSVVDLVVGDTNSPVFNLARPGFM